MIHKPTPLDLFKDFISLFVSLTRQILADTVVRTLALQQRVVATTVELNCLYKCLMRSQACASLSVCNTGLKISTVSQIQLLLFG